MSVRRATKRNRKAEEERRRAAAYPPGTIGAYVREYGEWLEARGYSPQTVRGRRHYLFAFADWCEDRGLRSPTEVTKPVIERYQSWLFHYRKKGGEPLTFRSQHAQLVPVRAFFKWMTRQNYTLYNPASEIELPRLDKPLPRDTMTAAEVEAVLAAIDPGEPFGLRDRAIIDTLYSSGIRRKELIGLQVYDIDFERGTVFIRKGKGGKDRIVPIAGRAAALVRKYLYEARPRFARNAESGFLFLNDRGEPYSPDRISLHVKRLIDAANTGKKGSCHLFRHTCATLMLEGGADIRFIQQQLGHAGISSTEIYTRVSIEKLKAIHTATHPGAKPESPGTSPGSGEKTAENPPA